MDLSALDRHDKIALMFSGGKDSLAVVYLLREHLPRVTVYHVNTGDLLPEIEAIVDYVRLGVPNFVQIDTDAMAWGDTNGLPTDLLPYTEHPLARMAGQGGNERLTSRYDCCYQNLMLPCYARAKADGCTLVIRGSKACDNPLMPTRSGERIDGMEMLYPIQDWSHADVQAYLRSVGAPHNRIYDHMTNAPECARCSAWWGEKRSAYLRQFHPTVWADYQARLRRVSAAMAESVDNLRRELADAPDTGAN